MYFQKGKIVDWKDTQGYGYIVAHNSNQKVFFHIKSFKNKIFRRPSVGDTVSFTITKDKENRLQANQITFEEIEVIKNQKTTKQHIYSESNLQSNSSFSSLLFLFVFPSLILYSTIQGLIPFYLFPIYISLSFVTFFIYWWDKYSAQNDLWRISEKSLHLFSLLGGWFGALLAQKILRHKSSKKEFQDTFKVTIILNLLGIIIYSYITRI